MFNWFFAAKHAGRERFRRILGLVGRRVRVLARRSDVSSPHRINVASNGGATASDIADASAVAPAAPAGHHDEQQTTDRSNSEPFSAAAADDAHVASSANDARGRNNVSVDDSLDEWDYVAAVAATGGIVNVRATDDDSDVDEFDNAFGVSGLLVYADRTSLVLMDTCPEGSRDFARRARRLLPEHQELFANVPLCCTLRIESAQLIVLDEPDGTYAHLCADRDDIIDDNEHGSQRRRTAAAAAATRAAPAGGQSRSAAIAKIERRLTGHDHCRDMLIRCLAFRYVWERVCRQLPPVRRASTVAARPRTTTTNVLRRRDSVATSTDDDAAAATVVASPGDVDGGGEAGDAPAADDGSTSLIACALLDSATADVAALVSPHMSGFSAFVGRELTTLGIVDADTDAALTCQLLVHAGRGHGDDFGRALLTSEAQRLRELNETLKAEDGDVSRFRAMLNMFNGGPNLAGQGGGNGGGGGSGHFETTRVIVWIVTALLILGACIALVYNAIADFTGLRQPQGLYMIDLAVMTMLPGVSIVLLVFGMMFNVSRYRVAWRSEPDMATMEGIHSLRVLRFLCVLALVITIVGTGLKWRALLDPVNLDAAVISIVRRGNGSLCMYQLDHNCTGIAAIEASESSFFAGNLTIGCATGCGYDAAVPVPSQSCSVVAAQLAFGQCVLIFVATSSALAVMTVWGTYERCLWGLFY